MRIVIDMQGAQTASRFRGIGRYTSALARAMLRNAGDHEIWLVLNAALEEPIAAIRAEFNDLVPQERIRVFEVPGHIAEMDSRDQPRCRAAELLREHFIAALQPDMVLVTSLFEGYVDDAVASVGTLVDGSRTAVILYDLIPLLNPAAYLGAPSQEQCYARKIASLKRAGLLLSISDYAREEAIGALALDPARVVAISTAVDECFAPRQLAPQALEAIRHRFGVTRAMLMCAPGGSDPRKNIAGLVTAYSLLPAPVRAAHQLLIASRLTDSDRAALLAHAAGSGLAPDELVLTGWVCDDDLVALYQAAALFVFPSLHEGFGLPALEAMACGAPVIGSDSTSIPEVIGLPEAMFDARSPSAIADKIAQVLGDPALLARLRSHGRAQAAKFTSDATARRALRALEAHAAAAPAKADAPGRAALVRALAALPGLEGDQATLVPLALCLAAMPDLQAPRQLLLDVTGCAEDAPALQALLREASAGMQVEPVILSPAGGAWHYRYARRPAGMDDGAAAQAVADLRTGDLLFCAAGAPGAVAAAASDGLYAHLRRLGVALHFLAAGDAAWLDAVADGADRLHRGDLAQCLLAALRGDGTGTPAPAATAPAAP